MPIKVEQWLAQLKEKDVTLDQFFTEMQILLRALYQQHPNLQNVLCTLNQTQIRNMTMMWSVFIPRRATEQYENNLNHSIATNITLDIKKHYTKQIQEKFSFVEITLQVLNLYEINEMHMSATIGLYVSFSAEHCLRILKTHVQIENCLKNINDGVRSIFSKRLMLTPEQRREIILYGLKNNLNNLNTREDLVKIIPSLLNQEEVTQKIIPAALPILTTAQTPTKNPVAPASGAEWLVTLKKEDGTPDHFFTGRGIIVSALHAQHPNLHTLLYSLNQTQIRDMTMLWGMFIPRRETEKYESTLNKEVDPYLNTGIKKYYALRFGKSLSPVEIILLFLSEYGLNEKTFPIVGEHFSREQCVKILKIEYEIQTGSVESSIKAQIFLLILKYPKIFSSKEKNYESLTFIQMIIQLLENRHVDFLSHTAGEAKKIPLPIDMVYLALQLFNKPPSETQIDATYYLYQNHPAILTQYHNALTTGKFDFLLEVVGALKQNTHQAAEVALCAYQTQRYFEDFSWGVLFLSDKLDFKMRFFNKLLQGQGLHQCIPSTKTITDLDVFLAPEPDANAQLVSLVPRANISRAEEKRLTYFFTLFPFIKTFATSYNDVLSYERIANALFKSIKNEADKKTCSEQHLKLSDVQLSLLRRIFSIADVMPLPQSSIPDLMILLVEHYQTYDVLENTDIDDHAVAAQTCQKLLTAAQSVEDYLSSDFVYATGYSDQVLYSMFDTHKNQALRSARQQAFALAYADNDALNHIARNSSSLSVAYQAHQHSAFSFTHAQLEQMRANRVTADDSISQTDTSCTGTTVLAGREAQREAYIKENKKMAYLKVLIHLKKGKTPEQIVVIDQLCQDIQSHLTLLFTGILSVASDMVERGNTTYTDTALDVAKAGTVLLPDPITRFLSSAALKGSQFLLDHIELKKFLKQARNLTGFEHMDLVKQELTGGVLEHLGEEILLLLNTDDKDTRYKKISDYLITQLVASILKQLKDNTVSSENTIHLGAILCQGFKSEPLDLKKSVEGFGLLSFSM